MNKQSWYKTYKTMQKHSDWNWKRDLKTVPIALSLLSPSTSFSAEKDNQNVITQKLNSTVSLNSAADFIAPFEGGHKLKAYKDSHNIWTIGVGFNLERKDADQMLKSVGAPTKNEIINNKKQITLDQSKKIFNKTVEEAFKNAQRWMPNLQEHPEIVQKICIDLSFNLGPTKLSNFKNTQSLIFQKKYKEAAKELAKSRWASQTGQRASHHIQVLNNL